MRDGAASDLAAGVVIVGAGLIGTSVGLALRAAGVPVAIDDADPDARELAVALGAGVPLVADADPALVVVCVPPGLVAPVIQRYQRLFNRASFTDVASVKTQVHLDLEVLRVDGARFVGGHPMAGRERSGAVVARADLFEGRPWVLCPTGSSDERAVRLATSLVSTCGAEPMFVAPDRHDRAVALVSHAPQLVSSAMAARLVGADEDLTALAGQGVRDVTRVAASDAGLWTEILTANASEVLPVLEGLIGDLQVVREALEAAGRPVVVAEEIAPLTELLTRGAAGRSRLPGKHGGRPATYAAVPVVVSDQPGQLATLFAAADTAGVNVEDVTIEHAAGHPFGVVELVVKPDVAAKLRQALKASGWHVHG